MFSDFLSYRVFLLGVLLVYQGVLGIFCVLQVREGVREIRASAAIRHSPHPASWDAFLRPENLLPNVFLLYLRAATVAPWLLTLWMAGHGVAVIFLTAGFPIERVVAGAIGLLYWVIGIEVVEIGNFPEFPICIVANHTSNLDIYTLLLLTARNFRQPCGFVAKADVLGIPFVGKISRLLGCVYVQRESAADRDAAVWAVERKLRHSQFPTSPARSDGSTEICEEEISDSPRNSLVIFPEGTTTVGNCLLPFKKALLEFPGVQYQAVWLEYSNALVSFTTTPQLVHLVLLFCLGNFRVTVHWLDPCLAKGPGNAEIMHKQISDHSGLRACVEANYRVHNIVADAVLAKMAHISL